MKMTVVMVAALLAVGCASSPNVTVMRMGPMYQAREPGCSLEFLNAQHFEIASRGYEQLGLVSFSGTREEMSAAASRMPDAVARAACEMGGSSVSLNVAIGTAEMSTIQFSVWRAPAKQDEKPGADSSAI